MPARETSAARAGRWPREVAEAEMEWARVEVTGSSAGGLVTARVTVGGDLLGISIDPRVLMNRSPAETAEAVADLVLAAIRNAHQVAYQRRATLVGPLIEDRSPLKPAGEASA